MSASPLSTEASTPKESGDPMPHPPLTYLVVIRWSTRERAYIAKAPGLSGCIGTGESYQAALNSCLEAMQWRAEQAEQRRQPLPPACDATAG